MKTPAYLFLVILFVAVTGFYAKDRIHPVQSDQTGALHDTAECTPVFPNVFTPNDDGMNDCISAVNAECVDSVKCTFYDRWGMVIYETKDPHFCWDGTNKKGQPVEMGTYYYVYEGKTHKGKKIVLKGNITMIR